MLRDLRLCDRREQADASVRKTGIGDCRKPVDAACAGVFKFIKFLISYIQQLTPFPFRNSSGSGCQARKAAVRHGRNLRYPNLETQLI